MRDYTFRATRRWGRIGESFARTAAPVVPTAKFIDLLRIVMPKHTIEEDDEILDEASFRQRVLELENYGF